MARKPHITLNLPKKDKQALNSMLSGGNLKVRTAKRINVLMQMNDGLPSPAAAKAARVTPETARAIVARYKAGGILKALYDAPRPGGKPVFNQKTGSQVIAMVCSKPPEGRARWTLDLIKEQVLKKGIVRSIGRETIRVLLHSHDIKPWREKNVVRA